MADQPMKGDIGLLNDGTQGVFGEPWPGRWCRGGVFYYAHEGKTIMRDGKPFPTTKEE